MSKSIIWLRTMKIVSVGLLATLFFMVPYYGGISTLFNSSDFYTLFNIDDYALFALSTIISAALCLVMVFSGVLGIIMRAPRLCTVFAYILLINAIASAGIIYYNVGLRPGFSLWDIKYEIITMLLAVFQIVCLIRLKKLAD